MQTKISQSLEVLPADNDKATLDYPTRHEFVLLGGLLWMSPNWIKLQEGKLYQVALGKIRFTVFDDVKSYSLGIFNCSDVNLIEHPQYVWLVQVHPNNESVVVQHHQVWLHKRKQESQWRTQGFAMLPKIDAMLFVRKRKQPFVNNPPGWKPSTGQQLVLRPGMQATFFQLSNAKKLGLGLKRIIWIILCKAWVYTDDPWWY